MTPPLSSHALQTASKGKKADEKLNDDKRLKQARCRSVGLGLGIGDGFCPRTLGGARARGGLL